METINLSTGPVNISIEVRRALSEPAISHRSRPFRLLLDDTLDTLRDMFSVRHAFIMSGSGTLANEVMLHQIKALGTSGLILSNGEFGSRLAQQAERIGLIFSTHIAEWGERFDPVVVAERLSASNAGWLLCCHCETSTGVLNDLETIAALCAARNAYCFADCMSSVGTGVLDLSNVTMASASSGKGLGAFPGLAVLLSNIDPLPHPQTPVYLDLAHYALKSNIPFTLSSNLLNAFHTAILQKYTPAHIGMIRQYGHTFHTILRELAPYSDGQSKVMTVALPPERKTAFTDYLQRRNIILSYESEYLAKRSWAQLALLGYYEERQLAYAAGVLDACMQVARSV
ncbi:aminotransferase class V-fold PLP-dependent enzyme [Chitinophaga lutea]